MIGRAGCGGHNVRVDPADFYTGIVAELYGPLKLFRESADEYATFIESSGEPALELGCGDGEPLLELRGRGLDVEGIDSSADMLDRLRRSAADRGLDVTVHRQKMQELNLPGRYRSIFLAGATFNLLPDDATALRALRAIRAHLAGGGSARVPLFIPGPTPVDQLGRAREAAGPGGAVLRVSVQAEELDEITRTRRTTLRYERVAPVDCAMENTATGDTATGESAPVESTVVERVWTLHWYTTGGFRELAAEAGLVAASIRDDDGAPAGADATSFTVILQASDDV